MGDVWRAIDVKVSPDPMHPQRFLVEFAPRGITDGPGPGGDPLVVPKNMVVTVQDERGLKVIAFSHTSSPILHLGQADYEQKAIQAVTEYRLANLAKPSAE